METLTNEELLIRLIKDSLINTKLISGLNSLGLNAHDYTLSLGDTIFLLMGFDPSELNDFIFDHVYLKNAEKMNDIKSPVSTEELDELSKEIYEALLFAKDISKAKE
jgi:hypothetical protein